jgi:hypothetical protein
MVTAGRLRIPNRWLSVMCVSAVSELHKENRLRPERREEPVPAQRDDYPQRGSPRHRLREPVGIHNFPLDERKLIGGFMGS